MYTVAEAQRGLLIRPRSHNWYISDLGVQSRQCGFRVCAFHPKTHRHQFWEKQKAIGSGKETTGILSLPKEGSCPQIASVFSDVDSCTQAHLQEHSCGHSLINNHDFCYNSNPPKP